MVAREPYQEWVEAVVPAISIEEFVKANPRMGRKVSIAELIEKQDADGHAE